MSQFVEPRLNEPCLAFLRGRWRSGKVLEVGYKWCRVLFVGAKRRRYVRRIHKAQVLTPAMGYRVTPARGLF